MGSVSGGDLGEVDSFRRGRRHALRLRVVSCEPIDATARQLNRACAVRRFSAAMAETAA